MGDGLEVAGVIVWLDFLRLGFVGGGVGEESACFAYNIMMVLYDTGEPPG